MNTHVSVGWFEIPVDNMERAMAFYGNVLDCSFERVQMGPIDMAWFPMAQDGGGAGGSLVFDGETKPSAQGITVYFSSKDVSVEIGRVEAAGGTVLVPKTLITEDIGYFALFLDSEGNRVALHSQQ
jgi:predicted enzyme related to lactoylglutathione lyase